MNAKERTAYLSDMSKSGRSSILTVPEKSFKGKQDPNKRKRNIDYCKIAHVHPVLTKTIKDQCERLDLNVNKHRTNDLQFFTSYFQDLDGLRFTGEHMVLLEDKVKNWLDSIPIYKSNQGTVVTHCFRGTISSRSSDSTTEEIEENGCDDNIQILNEKLTKLVIGAYRREVEVPYWNNNSFNLEV